MNWFEKKKKESLALRITDSNNQVVGIICKYKYSFLSKEDDYKLQEQLNEIFFTSDKTENIKMVGDFNLPNVDWENSFVVPPLNSISQHFRIKNEYLDLFTVKKIVLVFRSTLVDTN